MNILRLFENSVKVVDKYGIWKVFITIILIGLFAAVIYGASSFKEIVEKTTIVAIQENAKNREIEHIDNLEKRRAMQPKINAILDNFLVKTNADRAFIIELHNGSNNINGIPFLHASVTYEKVINGLDNIDEEYQNLSLSRFEMPSYLHLNLNFIGSMDELMKIDAKLAKKLMSNDVKYIAITTLHNGLHEWGWFGVLYHDEDKVPTEKEILNEMLICSQSVNSVLTLINN